MPETHKKKKKCDGHILLRLTRGSQNTIVSATHETHEFFFFFLAAGIGQIYSMRGSENTIVSATHHFFFDWALPQT